MPRKSKRVQNISSSQRDRLALERARLIPVALKPNEDTPVESRFDTIDQETKPFEYTMNWGEQGSVFVPQLLTKGQREDITSPNLRELVNITALGEKTPPELKKELMKEPIEGIYAAIREGFSRWHITGGKEQR